MVRPSVNTEYGTAMVGSWAGNMLSKVRSPQFQDIQWLWLWIECPHENENPQRAKVSNFKTTDHKISENSVRKVELYFGGWYAVSHWTGFVPPLAPIPIEVRW